MADYGSQSHDTPSAQYSNMSHEDGRTMSLGNGDGSPPTHGRDLISDGNQSAPGSAGTMPTTAAATSLGTAKPELPEQAQEVLASDIGVSTMLNRLKQSISAAKDFAIFLKKRSALEDDHAKGLKKIARENRHNAHGNHGGLGNHHGDHRQGSFASAWDDMLNLHERMAENGIQFASSLHQMHDDLMEVASSAEKHRKSMKQSGLAAEQRLADLETAMRKSKTKYDSLADDYDRVRTGESRQGGKIFSLKNKSAAQQEEDLLRKVQACDTDYMGKVQNYQSEKTAMEVTSRPEAIKSLVDLVRECDSGTTMQMQKFASFNEKLLLSNGLVISPLKNQANLPSSSSRSLKEVIQAVDNNKDLEEFILSQWAKMPAKSLEPKYERNAVLNPRDAGANVQTNKTTQGHQQQQPKPSQPPGYQPPPLQTQLPMPTPLNSGTRTDSLNFSSSAQQSAAPFSAAPSGTPPPGHERSYSHGAMLSQTNTPSAPQPYNYRNSVQAPPPTQYQRYVNEGGIGGAPQLGALPFQSGRPSRGTSPTGRNDGADRPLPSRSVSPPNAMGSSQGLSQRPGGSGAKQVFGVSLAHLYERDNLAVPMIVYQCIQAVNLYGLAVEGIYRLSGSSAHVQKLKNMFDTNSDSSNLDFRNPENFFHDVNSVAGLLKQFVRDLPEPLLTTEHYPGFIEAAKQDDEVVRRDSLHAIINALPDPNYATLRALALHLHRVTENSAINRMNSQNLAIVFGPTLIGTAPGANIADAGWQVRAVDTILQNTYQIFDEE